MLVASEVGDLAIVHQDGPETRDRDSAAVMGPLHQGRLVDQVAKCNVERVRQGSEDGDPVKRDPTVLHLAEPVSCAADEARQDLLGHAPSPAVRRDALADGECRCHPSHDLSVPPLSDRPRRIFRVVSLRRT